MELFAIKLLIIFLTFIKSSKCDCSYINSAADFELSLIVGEWFTIMRWENGIDNATTCTKSVITKDLDVIKTNYLPEGKQETVAGSFNTSASCKSTVILTWPPNIPSKVVVIYIDYENVGIVQACFQDTGK